MSEIRARAIAGLQPGDAFEVERTFRREETEQFGALTRDYNPIHHDTAFAACKGMSQPVLHGLLTGSMLCQIGGQLGWLATEMDFRFRRPVYPGDTIRCRLTLTEIAADGVRARAAVRFTNQRGEVVLEAELGGHLPTKEQRRAMVVQVAAGDPDNPLHAAAHRQG